jgi:hypothetical protein
VPSREGDFESAGEFPCDDFPLDILTEFFHNEGDGTIGRDNDEALSETVEPLLPPNNDPVIVKESDAAIFDGEGSGTTDDHSEQQTSLVMDSSDHGSPILSEEGGEDSEWSRSHKRRMLKRINSLLEAKSPASKKRCKRRVMDAYKEMSTAYSALERLLTARSTHLGSDIRGSPSLLGASNLDKK